MLLSFCLVSSAQTEQHGYVKTRGRMVDGVHVPGKGLVGAVVSVKGANKVGVMEDDGAFSFPVRDGSFTIQSVNKSGYVIVDADALPKTYTVSSNHIYLVMETPDQLLLDKLEAESKMLANVRRQLEERKKELEELKRQARITEEEYRSRLIRIYEAQSDEEKIVRDMAKRYSEIDYDQLDGFYRQVNSAVEQGDFSKADSLLRSQGDIDEQVEAYFRQEDAIRKEQDELMLAKKVHQHEKEEMAQRCYSYYESCFLQHKLDSASHYLQLRTRLDSLNATWQLEAGCFIYEYLADYDLAMRYFERSLEINRQVHGDFHPDVATSHNRMGQVYCNKNNHTKSIEHYTSALNIWKEIHGDSHPDVGVAYNNIGVTCSAMGDYSKALEYFALALDILKQEYVESHHLVTTLYDNMGMAYMYTGDFDNALKYLNMSLDARLEAFGDFSPETAISYETLGLYYQNRGEHVKALEHHKLALSIRQSYYGESHPLVTRSYRLIAAIYQSLGDNVRTLEYYELSLASRRKAVGDFHPEIAKWYNVIGLCYISSKESEKGLEYFNRAIVIWKHAFGEDNPNLISGYVSIAMAYLVDENISEGITYFRKAYDLSVRVGGKDNPVTRQIETQIENLELILKERNNESDGQ